MAGAIILNVTYGFNIEDAHDPLLVAAERALDVTNAICSTSSYLGVFLDVPVPA